MIKAAHNWSALLDQRTHRMEMKYHAKIGHIHVPNTVARLPIPGGAYYSTTNACGFRSDHEYPKKRGRLPRILVFGDSFTAGQECDNVERYSEQLGKLLNAEVFNFGLSGSAPDQQLLIYEEFAKDIEADLIVWGVTVHNIERIKMQYRPSGDRMSGKILLMPKPYFTLEGGQLELHHVPVPRHRNEMRLESNHQFLDEQNQPTTIQKVSGNAFVQAAKKVLDRAGLKDRFRALVYRLSGVRMYDDYSDPGSEGWQLLAAIIGRFKASAGNTPLLIAPLPTYHYVVDKLDPVYDSLFASLADPEAGLHVSQLSRTLVAGRTLNDRKQLIKGHYTPYGHQEIARLLAHSIEELDLLPAQHATAPAAPAVPQEQAAKKYILSISYDGNDSAAVLLEAGHVVAAAREEHFTGTSGGGGFPALAANYCLEQARIQQQQLDVVLTDRDNAAEIAQCLYFGGRIENSAVEPSSQRRDEFGNALATALQVAQNACNRQGDDDSRDSFTGHCLGPDFSADEILAFLDMYELPFERLTQQLRDERMASFLQEGKVVANFVGRMEYGSSVPGGRCILAPATTTDATLVAASTAVNPDALGADPGHLKPVLECLRHRSQIDEIIYSPLRLPGEPVALTPFDAYRVIMLNRADALFLGDFVVIRDQQPEWDGF
jgi:hypothetical protein